MNDTQIKELYAIAHAQTKRWGASKSFVSKWHQLSLSRAEGVR